MGGGGIVLEIDETVISRNGIIRSPSNVDDSISNTIWLLGIIQRDNIRNFRLIVLPDRKSETLTAIFRENINKKTTIVTDGHPSYPSAVLANDCQHIIVNHSEGFVNTEGESSNKIENLWSHLKADIRKMNGIPYNQIPSFLTNFSFRKKFITSQSRDIICSVFIRILQLLFS
ncbi:hypothetical protein DMUE_1363 [Dictyocoela muelleri]|nr:hypothetical protein DMUE_1363 [Dictyocoela muelleri]